MIAERCGECGREYEFEARRWRCKCGGALELDLPPFDAARIDVARYDMWRYRALLPLPPDANPITLGEGGTPCIPFHLPPSTVHRPLSTFHLKCEFLNPTGSFKDRGMSALVTALAAVGACELVEDSSGNAGSALAAFAARAGLPATIYTPAEALPAKLRQIEAYGAQLVCVPGPRREVSAAAQAAVERGAAYASHIWQPLNLAGQATTAFEVWEQLGRRAPDAVVMPVGQGTLLMGLYWGFRALLQGGQIEKLPRLIGAQPDMCAPLVHPEQADWSCATVADGTRIAQPVRGKHILAAVRETGGTLVAIPDKEILRARERLARAGVYVEPTSALAPAALGHFDHAPDATIVIVLTGHGLKSVA